MNTWSDSECQPWDALQPLALPTAAFSTALRTVVPLSWQQPQTQTTFPNMALAGSDAVQLIVQ